MRKMYWLSASLLGLLLAAPTAQAQYNLVPAGDPKGPVDLSNFIRELQKIVPVQASTKNAPRQPDLHREVFVEGEPTQREAAERNRPSRGRLVIGFGFGSNTGLTGRVMLEPNDVQTATREDWWADLVDEVVAYWDDLRLKAIYGKNPCATGECREAVSIPSSPVQCCPIQHGSIPGTVRIQYPDVTQPATGSATQVEFCEVPQSKCCASSVNLFGLFSNICNSLECGPCNLSECGVCPATCGPAGCPVTCGPAGCTTACPTGCPAPCGPAGVCFTPGACCTGESPCCELPTKNDCAKSCCEKDCACGKACKCCNKTSQVRIWSGCPILEMARIARPMHPPIVLSAIHPWPTAPQPWRISSPHVSWDGPIHFGPPQFMAHQFMPPPPFPFPPHMPPMPHPQPAMLHMPEVVFPNPEVVVHGEWHPSQLRARVVSRVSQPAHIPASWKVRANGSKVELVAPGFEAQCNNLSWTSSHVVLEGSVRVNSRKNGSRVEAQRVRINLADGSISIDSFAAPAPTTTAVVPTTFHIRKPEVYLNGLPFETFAQPLNGN